MVAVVGEHRRVVMVWFHGRKATIIDFCALHSFWRWLWWGWVRRRRLYCGANDTTNGLYFFALLPRKTFRWYIVSLCSLPVKNTVLRIDERNSRAPSFLCPPPHHHQCQVLRRARAARVGLICALAWCRSLWRGFGGGSLGRWGGLIVSKRLLLIAAGKNRLDVSACIVCLFTQFPLRK